MAVDFSRDKNPSPCLYHRANCFLARRGLFSIHSIHFTCGRPARLTTSALLHSRPTPRFSHGLSMIPDFSHTAGTKATAMFAEDAWRKENETKSGPIEDTATRRPGFLFSFISFCPSHCVSLGIKPFVFRHFFHTFHRFHTSSFRNLENSANGEQGRYGPREPAIRTPATDGIMVSPGFAGKSGEKQIDNY